ncbi:hypothetical protein JR316_0012129 [Psilocybe cubensis]|uniref:Uncharacterized protein n=1 Tax=Psilocybe cubensis TaxID=181762 RepID=A0ACB8GHD4_PSICU|nr:hypothetical protein JR316_0012129 [Psilocybe cubensis]KAH9475028.1 hypothetical protein JR316_0012129 [Psilocybe cubensis]
MASVGTDDQTDPVVATRFLQCWLVGNIMGALAYGVSLTLSWNCIILLSRPTSTTPVRMRRLLMALIVFMCMVSTAALILATGGVLRWSQNPSTESLLIELKGSRVWGQPYSLVELILIVLATWCSDGFMRYSILSLFALVSLVANGSIASLIVARIVYHQKFLRKIFGNDYGSEYTKIMSILVESASITLTLNFLHIILAAAYGRVTAVESPANMIIIKLIVQVNTISPILIIFRVAQGRTWQVDPTRSSPVINGVNLGHLSSLHFAARDTHSVHSLTTLDDSRHTVSA